jgi:hypothetical protein
VTGFLGVGAFARGLQAPRIPLACPPAMRLGGRSAPWRGNCRALTAIAVNRNPYVVTAISTNAVAIAPRPIWWSRMYGPAVCANQGTSCSAQMTATRVPMAMVQVTAKAGPQRV